MHLDFALLGRGAQLILRGLQSNLENLFDHLYANAPMRTPTGIWHEVEKVVRTGMFMEETSGLVPAFNFSRSELNKLRQRDPQLVLSVASLVRGEFNRMNLRRPPTELLPGIELDNLNLVAVCQAFSGVALTSEYVDVLGEALEAFRHNWTKRNGGQFFTDPSITRLALELLDFDPQKGHDLVDIAAGTGGFLIAAANRIKRSISGRSKHGAGTFARVVKKSLKGVEIDRSLAEMANATMGSRIGDSDTRIVAVGDSLDPGKFDSFASVGVQSDSHICAVTNPPFGSKIRVKNPEILRYYELASIYSRSQPSKRLTPSYSPTSLEMLFIERNIRLLKPGEGRLAIIVPYQITSGPQAFPVRQWLLRHVELEAVVDLPADTFQPYTGTKTCLLLLRRRLAPLSDLKSVDDRHVFMSVPKWIGHDRRGKPVFKAAPDGSPTDEILSDIDAVGQAFHSFRNGGIPTEAHPGSFSVPAIRVYSDPQLRFNARYFQPNDILDSINTSSMSSAWRAVKLGDVTKRIFFPSRFKRRYVEESDNAVPFLGGTNISQLVPVVEKWLSREDPLVEKLQVSPGWILVTRSGSTGIVSSVPAHWAGWAVSEHVIRVVPDPEALHPMYLEAYLRTKLAKASIQRGVFGSVIDEITPDFLSETVILIPNSDTVKNRIIQAAVDAQQARERAIGSIAQAVGLLETCIEKSAV